MIQQIQTEEEDDITDSEQGVSESNSDVNDGDSEAEVTEDSSQAVPGSTGEWSVVSVKPGGLKTSDHNQYAD